MFSCHHVFNETEYDLVCITCLISYDDMVVTQWISSQSWTVQRLERTTKHNSDIMLDWIYHQTSNMIRTLVGNKIVDRSDVVEASPVGAAPTTCSFTT